MILTTLFHGVQPTKLVVCKGQSGKTCDLQTLVPQPLRYEGDFRDAFRDDVRGEE